MITYHFASQDSYFIQCTEWTCSKDTELRNKGDCLVHETISVKTTQELWAKTD